MTTPGPAAEITWEQVMAVRMRRHVLEQRGTAADLIPLARTLCGYHGQVLSSAELTAAVRLDGLSPNDFRQALWQDRTLYKTWAMRGTLHILPSDQFPTWIAALSHLPRADESAAWRKYFGIDSASVDALIHAIDVALKDEIHSRESLATAAASIAGRPELKEKLTSGWGAFLKPAARLGLVCFAPGEGTRVRFTHPRSWLPAIAEVDPDEGLRTVLRQFFHTYGPANRKDFMRWFGVIKASLADRMLHSIADETVEVTIVGEPKPYLALAAEIEEMEDAEPSTAVRLLPGFDQYVVNAPRGIEAILPQDRAADVYRPQGWISSTIVVGGRIAGTWSHEVKPNAVQIAVTPFARLNRELKHSVEAEADRLATWFELPVQVTWA
jgi:hypothetical protein